jgi:hypothetical protein
MTTPATTPVKSPAKKRHPVELWLVRCGIATLVVLVGVQAHARFGYQMTLNKLQARLAAEDETAEPLLVSEVNGLVVGFPSQTEESDRHWRRRTYSWRGLTQSYQISMPYDSSEESPSVMSLVTAGASEVVEPPPSEESTSSAGESTPSMPHMPTPGGPTMGGAGGGGRGQRPDLMASDKDGDGRVSKAEAPEQVAENFDRWDSNTDGFIDKEEIAAARERFRQQRGNGGPNGGDRPRRPATEAADEAKPAEASSEEKPADAAAATDPAQ